MCRYSMHDYPTSWVCIPCRHVASLPTWADAPRCPSCRSQLVDLGRDFKAPPRRSDTRWLAVEVVARAGLRYNSCGCTGPGSRPSTMAEVRRFLLPAPRAARRLRAG